MPPARYKARITPFWIAWEVMLCCLMLTSLAVWFVYAIRIVQDDHFSTRWGGHTRWGGYRASDKGSIGGAMLNVVGAFHSAVHFVFG